MEIFRGEVVRINSIDAKTPQGRTALGGAGMRKEGPRAQWGDRPLRRCGRGAPEAVEDDLDAGLRVEEALPPGGVKGALGAHFHEGKPSVGLQDPGIALWNVQGKARRPVVGASLVLDEGDSPVLRGEHPEDLFPWRQNGVTGGRLGHPGQFFGGRVGPVPARE